MADTKYASPSAADTLADTALNSLATAGLVLCTEDDNLSSDLDLLADFELYVSGVGASVTVGTELAQLWLIPSFDGSNYPDDDDLNEDPSAAHFVGSFVKKSSTGTGACRAVIWGVSIPPRKYKVVIKNVCGQTWAATSNTLKQSKYHIATA